MATFASHLLTGVHGSRPAANAVPAGTLYACSTHGLIYQSDGSSTWSTWATVTGSGFANPMTTAGDLITGGASGAPGRLAVGSNGQILSVVAGAPAWAAAGGGSGLTVVDAAAECAISSASPTTNNSDSGTVGQATGSFAWKNLMQFSLSGISAITRALLRVTVLDFGNALGTNEGNGQYVRAERILRTDVNYAQATWNIYKTGSNWNTAGAAGVATDFSRDNTAYAGPFSSTIPVLVPLATGAVVEAFYIDITALAQDAITAGASNLDLLITSAATGGQNTYTIASRTNATTARRPKFLWQ